MTEDRQKFAEELAVIGEPVAPSKAAYTVEEVCVCVCVCVCVRGALWFPISTSIHQRCYINYIVKLCSTLALYMVM